jgi:Transmembrane secretion effector
LARSGLGPEYTKLWSASTVSNLGDGVTLVAGPLLVASLTRDPVLVAGIAFAQQLPWLLFSLISGALVDRLDRRRVMWTVDAFRTVLLGFLGLAVLLDFVSIPLLYVVFFLMGTAETLFDTASVSILPAVVPPEKLEKANGRLFGAEIVSNQLAAPPLGGFPRHRLERHHHLAAPADHPGAFARARKQRLPAARARRHVRGSPPRRYPRPRLRPHRAVLVLLAFRSDTGGRRLAYPRQ